MMTISQRQTREMSYSNTYPWRSAQATALYLHRHPSCRPLKKKPTRLKASHPESIPAAAPGTRSPDMCFAAGLRACRLRAHTLQACHPTQTTSRG